MGDDDTRISDFYSQFIRVDSDEYESTLPTKTKAKSRKPVPAITLTNSTTAPRQYHQTSIDYDYSTLRPSGLTVAEVQAMLDDMREKIVQQILDEVAVLIDEALSR